MDGCLLNLTWFILSHLHWDIESTLHLCPPEAAASGLYKGEAEVDRMV